MPPPFVGASLGAEARPRYRETVGGRKANAVPENTTAGPARTRAPPSFRPSAVLRYCDAVRVWVAGRMIAPGPGSPARLSTVASVVAASQKTPTNFDPSDVFG